jgi:predicted RNase H-like HicB family nuclease
MARHDHPIVLEPLPDDDGGGWLATVPDLPGCMSDGDSQEEAAHNVRDAIVFWMEAAEDLQRAVPAPGSARGEWRQRVPKTLHEKLRCLAEAEGVSLNALVTSVLAERVGRS